MQDTFQRQRMIAATMNPSASSSSLHCDAAYMTAIANLRHREALLNLDRAIHEAEKRRYNSFSYPSPLASNFASGLPGSGSLPSNMPSFHHAYRVGNLTRGLSIGSASALGSSFHEGALLHSRLGGSGSHLKGDIHDRLALHPGVLPVREIPFSSNLTSRSREMLAEVDHLLKSRATSQHDHSNDSNPKSPR
jgi:hypothetical protein